MFLAIFSATDWPTELKLTHKPFFFALKYVTILKKQHSTQYNQYNFIITDNFM